MFETEIFYSVFTKVFAALALFIMISMPFVFKNMKYEGKHLGFRTIYRVAIFAFLTAAFSAHLVDVGQGTATVTILTFVYGLGALTGAVLFYTGYFRYLFK